MKPSDNLAILAVAKAFNVQNEISGILVYKDQTFLQLLEGPQDAVQGLYRKIRKDPRHTDIQTLINAPTYNRYFPQPGLEFRTLDNTAEENLPPYHQGAEPRLRYIHLHRATRICPYGFWSASES